MITCGRLRGFGRRWMVSGSAAGRQRVGHGSRRLRPLDPGGQLALEPRCASSSLHALRPVTGSASAVSRGFDRRVDGWRLGRRSTARVDHGPWWLRSQSLATVWIRLHLSGCAHGCSCRRSRLHHHASAAFTSTMIGSRTRIAMLHRSAPCDDVRVMDDVGAHHARRGVRLDNGRVTDQRWMRRAAECTRLARDPSPSAGTTPSR